MSGPRMYQSQDHGPIGKSVIFTIKVAIYVNALALDGTYTLGLSAVREVIPNSLNWAS
jgi:uncharacterized membrane protein YfbV (UPF0208 family)